MRWAWIVASLKPKLFCGVALMGEKFPSARVRVGAANCDAYHLRHNNCQTTILLSGRATPPHLQNQLDVAFVCFRLLVRNGRLYGQKDLLSSTGGRKAF